MNRHQRSKLRLIARAALLALPAALLCPIAPLEARPATGPASARPAVEEFAIEIAPDDIEMRTAIKRARRKLRRFLRYAARPRRGRTNFRVKVRLQQGDRIEHVWVTPFSGKPRLTSRTRRFSGIVANTPRLIRSVKRGDEISFTRDQITDWGYTRRGRQYGSYTTCVLIRRMAPAEARHYRRYLGFRCKK